jgi:hypothetical protein
MDLEARVKEYIKGLQGHIKANILAEVGGEISIAGLAGSIQSMFLAKAKKQKPSLAESLFESGASADRVTNNVLSLFVGASIELSQCMFVVIFSRREILMAIIAIINVMNFYLDQPDVVEQLRATDASNPALEAYVSEAMRKAISTNMWRCVLTILVA